MKLITIESKTHQDDTLIEQALFHGQLKAKWCWNDHDGRIEVLATDKDEADLLIDAIKNIFHEYGVERYVIDTISTDRPSINSVETNDYFYRNIYG